MTIPETPTYSRSNLFAGPHVKYRLSLASILALSFGSLITVSILLVAGVCYLQRRAQYRRSVARSSGSWHLASSQARLRTI